MLFFIENNSVSTENESQGFDAREEPDGEETISRGVQPLLSQLGPSPCTMPPVRVPNWILADTTLKQVVFNERATQQINEFQINQVSVSKTIFKQAPQNDLFSF